MAGDIPERSPILASFSSTTPGVHARGARGAAPATRGRRRLGRSRRRPPPLPRTVPTCGDDQPCPCGGRADPRLQCSCSRPPGSPPIAEKVSRALLDRFDLAVAMPRPRAEQLAGRPSGVVGRRWARVVDGVSYPRPALPVLQKRRTPFSSTAPSHGLPLHGPRPGPCAARVARTVAALAGSTDVSCRSMSPRRSRTRFLSRGCARSP